MHERSVGDTLLITLTTDTGQQGWGEVLPRSYVTGETCDDIVQNKASSLANTLLGEEFSDETDVLAWVESSKQHLNDSPALTGGYELALWSALSRHQLIDWERLIGPQRRESTGNCVTIGLDAATSELRARIIAARLQKATVIKLKLGAEDDIVRLGVIDGYIGGRLPIRLDANGTFTVDQLDSLLADCHKHSVSLSHLHSIEQPFAKNSSNEASNLKKLFLEHGVSFMADESICTRQDANQWLAERCYQYVNLRIGKHGGLIATRDIRSLCEDNGVAVVCGSMVGESGILTNASTLFLHHSSGVDYVEGLGQNKRFLAADPVVPLVDGVDEKDTNKQSLLAFAFNAKECGRYMHVERIYQ